jgi:hypothetical protein
MDNIKPTYVVDEKLDERIETQAFFRQDKHESIDLLTMGDSNTIKINNKDNNDDFDLFNNASSGNTNNKNIDIFDNLTLQDNSNNNTDLFK